MDTKLFYIFIVLLIKTVKTEVSDNSVNNNDVVYNTNSTRCNMYSIFCRVSVFVRKELNIEDLTIKSSDEHKFSYKSIELCPSQPETTNTTKLDLGCMLKNNLTKEIIDNYNMYSIKLDANIIGKAKLEISVKEQKYEQNVIIVQPMRLIDILFTIYAWAFALLISLLMGLILDINTLIKIIKIPIPVGIGLSCQYMIMPLVILFNKLIYSDF